MKPYSKYTHAMGQHVGAMPCILFSRRLVFGHFLLWGTAWTGIVCLDY